MLPQQFLQRCTPRGEANQTVRHPPCVCGRHIKQMPQKSPMAIHNWRYRRCDFFAVAILARSAICGGASSISSSLLHSATVLPTLHYKDALPGTHYYCSIEVLREYSQRLEYICLYHKSFYYQVCSSTEIMPSGYRELRVIFWLSLLPHNITVGVRALRPTHLMSSREVAAITLV